MNAPVRTMSKAALLAGFMLAAPFNAFAQNLSIPPIPDNERTIGNAVIETHRGEFTANGQRSDLSFTAPRDGIYRFEMAELRGYAWVNISVLNRLNQRVDGGGGGGNGQGRTLALRGGETYAVQISQGNGLSPFHLIIGHQKETVDVSRLTRVADSIEYTGQRNVYTFTAPRSGVYRFEMAELRGGAWVNISVWDRLEQRVDHGGGGGNGQGRTLNLIGGQTYAIHVSHGHGLSPYHLIIGHQKETVDVSRLTRVSDSIQYTGQRNVYTFTAPADGTYRFEMAELRGGAWVNISVWDRLEQRVDRGGGGGNGQGRTLNLIGGQTYAIHVSHGHGLSPYVFIIARQN